MSLLELQEYAQENGYDSVRFSFINFSLEKVTARWLDAYLGLFIIDGYEGFITMTQAKKAGFYNFKYTIENE